MKRSALYLAAAAIGLAAAIGGYFLHQQRQAAQSQELATRQLLALAYPDLEGKPRPLAQWRGRVLVVNLWATWCAPCREEMPAFSRLQQRYAANGVQFIGIGIDTGEKMRQFAREVPVSYPLLVGDTSILPIAAMLGNHAGGLPHTMLIDAHGRLRHSKLGVWREDELAARLDELVAG